MHISFEMIGEFFSHLFFLTLKLQCKQVKKHFENEQTLPLFLAGKEMESKHRNHQYGFKQIQVKKKFFSSQTRLERLRRLRHFGEAAEKFCFTFGDTHRSAQGIEKNFVSK